MVVKGSGHPITCAARHRSRCGTSLPSYKRRQLGPLPPHEELRERVDIVIVRTVGKPRELIQKIVNPRPLRDEPTVRLRIREVDVPRFDLRLRGVRAGQFAAFGLDGNDARDPMTKHLNDCGAVRGVLDQNRRRRRILLPESLNLPAAFAECPEVRRSTETTRA